MTEITLVRHGETDWNRDGIIQGRFDIPLNETGIKQAEVAMEKLKGNQFDHIFSTPLIRTKQTALIIAKGLGYRKTINTIPNLIERDFGEADGKPVENYYPLVLKGDVKDMESNEALEQRVMSALHDLVKEYPNGKLLVVCHSHVIKAVLRSLDPKQYNYQTRLLNGSATTLRYDSKLNTFTIEKIVND